MNTNIFSTYDMAKGITTKSPILVEIDGSKSGVYSPSPLIFTTAKIHTDSKTKLMEPLQVTPVPILSTIEGSVVRAGGLTNTDKVTTSVPQPQDSIISVCGKFDKNEIRTAKDKQTISSASKYVSPNIEIISNNKMEYQTKATNESVIIKSLVNTTDYTEKNQANGQLNLNAGKLDNNVGETSNKHEVLIPIVKSHIDPVSKILKPTGEIKKKTSDSSSSSVKTENSSDSSKSVKLQQQATDTTKSSISVPFEIKVTNMSADKISALKSSDTKRPDVNVGNTVEKSFTSSKKLQRQKNASIQDVQDMAVGMGEISKTAKSTENMIPIKDNRKNEQVMAQDIIANVVNLDKISSTTVVTAHNLTKSSVSTSTLSKPTASSSLVSTSNVKPITTYVGMTSSKSSSIISSKTIPKSSSKSPIVSPDSSVKNIPNLPPSTSVKTTTTATMTTKCAPEKPCIGKPDTAVSPTISYEQGSKGEKSVNIVSTTLPSYIVSTSKTKIGSTFTSNTNTSTTKSQTSTSITQTVFTTSSTMKSPGTQQSARPIVGISPTNGTKRPNFSKQTQSDTVKKDGRA